MKEWKIFRRGGEDFFYGTLFWCCEKCENKKGEKENGNFLCVKREREKVDEMRENFWECQLFFCCYFSLLSVSYHPSLGVILIVCQKCVFTHPYQASFKLLSTENVKRRHSHCSSYNNSSWNSNTEKERERESAMNLECEWRHTQGREAEEQENLENVNQAFQRENQRIKYGKMLRKSMKNGKWGEGKSISTRVKVVALSSSFLFVDPSFSASFGLIFSLRVSSCALCFAFLLLLSIEHFVVKKLWVKFHRRKLSDFTTRSKLTMTTA